MLKGGGKMKIQNLTLKNWKCFRDEKSFEFDEGINLIHGENEAGKSSAIDGLRRAFFDKHTTSGEKMRAIQPWGSEGLSPTVKVGFEKNGNEYRIKKKFLHSESSLLEKKVQGEWERISEGDAADKKIIDMIGGSLPGRGASKPKHWGLAQALWTQQGKIIPEGEFNNSFKERIRKMIGDFVPSEKGSKVSDKIEKELQNNLTPKNRDPAAGGELKELENEIDKYKNKVQDLREKFEETEEIRVELEDKKIEKNELEEKKEKAEQRLTEAEELVKDAVAHKDLREEKEDELSETKKIFEKIDEKIKNIEERERNIEEEIEERENLGDEIEELMEDKETKSERIDELRKEKDDLRNGLDENEYILDDYREVEQIIQKKKGISHISEKQEEVEKLNEDIKDIEQEIQEKDAPDKGEFDELKELHDKLHEKEIQMETIGLQANIIANSEVEGSISLDDEEESFELNKGDEKEWTTPQNLSLEIGNLVNVNIRSGSEDVKELKNKIEKYKNQFESRTEVYGTNDIEKLREMMESLKGLKRRVNKKEGKLSGIELPKLPSMEDTNGVCPFCDNEHRDGRPYQREGDYDNHIEDCASDKDKISLLKSLNKRLETQIEIKWNQINDNKIVEKYKNSEELTNRGREIQEEIDGLKGEREKLKDKRDELQKVIMKVRKEEKIIENEISDLRDEKSSLEGKIDSEREELEKLKDDDMDMDKRKDERDELEIKVKRLEKRVDKLQEEKQKKEDRPFEELKQAENSLGSIKEEIQELDKKISELRGQLKQKVKEGIYSKLTNAEEKLSSLKREKERKEKRVRSIELLYDLINYHKEESMRTVMKPLEDNINEDLERIIGRDKYKVRLDEEVKPGKIEPKTWDTKADTDLLSYGTKEQIAFSFRLSLGKILSEQEDQLVILDDPLANTDNPRLHRSIGVLEDYSDDLQIFLITCDKTKYSGLSEPNIIEL